MKPWINTGSRAVLPLALLAGLMSCAASAQSNVYSLNIIGYVNHPFQAGLNLFGNPLLNTSDSLSVIIPTAPSGATVSLWDATTGRFSQTAVFWNGAWSVDLSLHPGQGALLTSPSAFLNTFVGEVLAPDGSPYDGITLNPPPVFSGPAGVYLLSSACPIELGTSIDSDTFLYILGRPALSGEKFTWLDPATQELRTTTFENGEWDNGTPQLGVGQAAFFSLEGGPGLLPVPEPSGVVLLLLGSGILLGRRCRFGATETGPGRS